MQTPKSILEQLKPLASLEGFEEAERILNDPATRLRDPINRQVAVGRVAYVWETRLAITRQQDLPPYCGCEHLVRSLSRFPADMILNMIALSGADTRGAVWFVEKTEEPVGFIFWKIASADGSLPNQWD